MTFNERIEKARQHNAAFDAIDRKHGNRTPAEAGPTQLFNTGMEAIKAGVSCEDLDMVAEGYIMLLDFIEMFNIVKIPASSPQKAIMELHDREGRK